MVDTRPPGSSIYTGTYTGTTLYNYDVTYHGVSGYLQAEVRPVERFRLDAGVRVDGSGYNYTTATCRRSTRVAGGGRLTQRSPTVT